MSKGIIFGALESVECDTTDETFSTSGDERSLSVSLIGFEDFTFPVTWLLDIEGDPGDHCVPGGREAVTYSSVALSWKVTLQFRIYL
jgi:hypothetical protein